MRLTTFTDYSLRVLMFLALHRDRRVTIPEIAAAYEISENHLTKVVHQLARAGTIASVRGKGGGIYLAHAPEDIQLGTVIRRCEGDAPIVECLADTESTCRIAPACRLSAILNKAFEALYVVLDDYTLADLVDRPRKLKALLNM